MNRVSGKNETTDWLNLRQKACARLLRMHFESGVGHIGGNLSCLDLLLTLHHEILDPTVDQFVLSKGHSAGAYYVTLWTLGLLSEEDLSRFHQEGTHLPGHPPSHGVPGVLFATGSLGHGLPLAAGLALAKQLKGEPGHVYCLTSDGEWNEGSCWESLIFARQRQLSNLTILVDLNGLQGFGTTSEVADLNPIEKKFQEFGVSTHAVDGHNHTEIQQALKPRGIGPCAVVARTHKGAGISFMEDRMEWHYLPMTKQQFEQAILEVENA